MEIHQDLQETLPGPEGLVLPGVGNMSLWSGYILAFLEKQPKSWNTHWTLPDVILQIVKQELTPILYFRNSEVLGLALVSLQTYGTHMAMRVEFLSCENFFATTKMLDVMEERARLLGCDAIEAIAHPAIAAYACKKKGFDKPTHYIRKHLPKIRRH